MLLYTATQSWAAIVYVAVIGKCVAYFNNTIVVRDVTKYQVKLNLRECEGITTLMWSMLIFLLLLSD